MARLHLGPAARRQRRRLRITAEKAFDVLVRLSNDTKAKLRDVARTVVDTGELPR